MHKNRGLPELTAGDLILSANCWEAPAPLRRPGFRFSSDADADLSI
jgi:hypothetical protein